MVSMVHLCMVGYFNCMKKYGVSITCHNTYSEKYLVLARCFPKGTVLFGPANVPFGKLLK